ncbi:MAG: hypothetical protein GY856_07635 [bacterium]|nr:hypothetical protein [bacterium]
MKAILRQGGRGGDSRLSWLRSEVEQIPGPVPNLATLFLLPQGLRPLAPLGRRVAEEFLTQTLEPMAG